MAETPKGYVVAEVDVHDAEGFAAYRATVPAVIAQYGGHYVARGGALIGVEGEPPSGRVVIVEFPSKAQAEAFVSSPEYAPVAAIRHRTSSSRLFVIEGVDI
ncbi:MAG: DUF1330 domain-containing protein [Novosphingobium sp.]|uniref:DUF1330 domain-containing protein n=1 Tax=Novosphingobium sp. TaxID=1874826 RepID=UPI003017DF5F